MAETKTVRPIAMGVGAIRIADVGDGVPGTDLPHFPYPPKVVLLSTLQTLRK